MNIKIGLIREGKVPPDKRVPLTPEQCIQVMEQYPDVKIVVQESPIRIYHDDSYRRLGIPVVDNLNDCDIIMGVKEVNLEDLIPNKHFFFFSHTLKEQPYNRKLLQGIIKHKIQLTDYETLKDSNNKRIIGFGKYAGIVGAFNAFRTYGLKHNRYRLKPAYKCHDKKEMEGELPKINLPSDLKIVVTGKGRVGSGITYIMEQLPIEKVSVEDFLTKKFDKPVYTHLVLADYVARKDGFPFEKQYFYKNPKEHKSIFSRFLKVTDMFIAGHYWEEGSPFLYTREDLKQENLRISVVADISCDIDGPVASTIRPSTIADPIYGYSPKDEKEIDFMNNEAIAVMAVDNLPCELPRNASVHFGKQLIKSVFPVLFSKDPDKIIERATETTKEGRLSPYFEYLTDYLNGVESVKE